MSDGTCKAFFLVGPTATGKSAIAQRLAEQSGSWILSADSMLVYRGMDIGTAKPDAVERGRVRYWGVDLVGPGEAFNVARYLEVARAAALAARDAGVPLIVAGGTGLYVRGLLQGLSPLPAGDPAVRARWQSVLASEGPAALQAALRERAPRWLEALPDPGNARRLIRALELAEGGVTVPPAEWGQREVQPEVAGLRMPRSVLDSRIRARVEAMYAGGLIEEVRQLLQCRQFAEWPTAAQAVGYAEAVAFLQGHIGEHEARERTIVRTRQLAKRQMTWFKHQCRVRWIDVDGSEEIDVLAGRVRRVWDEIGATPLA